MTEKVGIVIPDLIGDPPDMTGNCHPERSEGFLTDIDKTIIIIYSEEFHSSPQTL